MTDQNIGNTGDTDNTTSNNHQESSTETVVKTYTQAEVDNIVSKAKGHITQKVSKQYEELGSVEDLRQLITEKETRQQEEEIAKGNFEKTLKTVVDKKDAKIASLEDTVKGYLVNTPILNAAAQHRSNNPEQVRALLASQVQLNADGEAQVVDSKNNARYNDSGKLLTVDELVVEFLDSNPHFVQPTPATTNSNSSHDTSKADALDITKLDMKDPKHRAQYAKYRKEHGLA